MRDKILDFIEEHRKLVLAGLILLVLFVLLMIVRGVNLKRKAEEEARLAAEQARLEELALQETPEPTEEPEPEQPIGDYNSGIGNGSGDGRVDPNAWVPPVETPEPVKTDMKNPPYVTIWDWSNVPSKGSDGSSFTNYMNKFEITNVDSKWGSSLTDDDYLSETRYLIGMFQNDEDTVRGNLQSLGWLINNLDTMNESDCIRFTDLHVMKHCSKTHVAMLCMFNWYSAFGLKDVLVFFEDISGTLSIDDFKAGDTFTTIAYVHNIKLETVNKQTVVNVQYALYEGDLDD